MRLDQHVIFLHLNFLVFKMRIIVLPCGNVAKMKNKKIKKISQEIASAEPSA